MKILINTLVIGSEKNGFTTYTVNILDLLIKRLQEAGHHIVILSSSSKYFESYSEAKILRLPSFFDSSYGKGSLRAFLRLFFNIFILPLFAWKFDLLYSTTPHGIIFPITKQIVTIHDFISMEFPKQHRFQYYYTKYFLRYVLSASIRIIVISRSTEKQLHSLFPAFCDRTVCIYNGCSDNFYPHLNATSFIAKQYHFSDYLLACGLSYPHKNISMLIEAYALLPDALRKSHPLVLVGSCKSEYAAELRRQVLESNAKDAIFFTDTVPDADLPLLYSAAKVFIYPSRSEGFGLPPLEALQCGTPCIVSNLPVMHEILGNSVTYIDTTDAECIKKALEQELSGLKNMPSSIPSYTWEESADKIYKLLTNIENET